MPMPCYLIVEGEKQGKIEGSVKVKGHEGKILVQAVDHVIEIPKSPQTGLPTGKRVHQPMTLTKEIDKASPKLFQALTSGEQTQEREPGVLPHLAQGHGREVLHRQAHLGHPDQRPSWTPNCLNPENKQMGHMEDISFTYEKITWTFEPDGIEAEDSWLAPK
jgi:type VI secretion system secreted protein Hcp